MMITQHTLTNVVGPVSVDSDELQLPEHLLQACYQPDERLPQEYSDCLMKVFTNHLYL